MNRFSRICCLLLLLTISVLSRALAWNRATHMVTGAIAYQELQQTNPKLALRVATLLRQHPDYPRRWASKLRDSTLTDDDRNQYLFMLAARWADDVRGTAYDHPTWHYIDYIYAPELGIARTDTALDTGETILQAYAANQQILRSRAPDSAKAIALCWIFHLTGDIHMPLHTTALVDQQFPKGDQGGNLFKIKVMMAEKTINLHSFWDGMLLGSDDFQSVQHLAIQLRHEFPRDQLAQLGKQDIVAWSKESFQLARDNAYRSNTLQPGTPEDGTVLPPDYVATVKPIASRQVALAGYRLTDELVADVKR